MLPRIRFKTLEKFHKLRHPVVALTTFALLLDVYKQLEREE